MKLKVSKLFKFDAAHQLSKWHEPISISGSKEDREKYDDCATLHGHSFHLEVTVKGEVKDDGFVINFKELKQIVQKNIIDLLDHNFLNDCIFELPTAENLIQFIYEKIDNPIRETGNYLVCLRLWESDTSFVTLELDN